MTQTMAVGEEAVVEAAAVEEVVDMEEAVGEDAEVAADGEEEVILAA